VDLSFGQGSLCQVPRDTSNYIPEPTTAFASDGIQSAFDWTYGENGFSDEVMQAIKNPTWWSGMMMPGFSWPEGSPSPPANSVASPLYRQDLDLGRFQTMQVIM